MTSDSDLQKFKTLICQKDSTSKFVAFFLLLQILNNDREAAAQCWQYIEPSFLDKLILAGGKNVSTREAQDLQALGSSILHAYATFEQIASSHTYIKRSEALMKLYISGKIIPDETREKMEGVLETIATQAEGAANMISGKCYLDFVKKVVQQQSEPGSSLLYYILIHSTNIQGLPSDLFQEQIKSTIEAIAESLDLTVQSRIYGLGLLAKIMPVIPHERFKLYVEPKALDLIMAAIRIMLLKPVKGINHGSTLLLLAAVLRVHGHDILWDNKQAHDKTKLFVITCTLASSELRSSLAPLFEKRHSSEYMESAMHVASYFDILRIITLYLTTTEETPLKSDEIIRIRDNFSAAYGESIAYLRDRWDCSPFSPNSVHHVGPDAVPSHSDKNLPVDATILAGTQSLCLWLQEDESVQSDACGIMDALIGLIKESSAFHVNYATWILPAIEALLELDKGRAEFARLDGFDVVKAQLLALSKIVTAGFKTTSLDRVSQDANKCLSVMVAADPAKADAWMQSNERFIAMLETSDD